MKDEIKLQILQYSYWEHFKYAKDIALILPLDHPRRVAAEKSLNEIQHEINNLKGERSENP